jgi:hypothetical protein
MRTYTAFDGLPGMAPSRASVVARLGSLGTETQDSRPPAPAPNYFSTLECSDVIVRALLIRKEP